MSHLTLLLDQIDKPRLNKSMLPSSSIVWLNLFETGGYRLQVSRQHLELFDIPRRVTGKCETMWSVVSGHPLHQKSLSLHLCMLAAVLPCCVRSLLLMTQCFLDCSLKPGTG